MNFLYDLGHSNIFILSQKSLEDIINFLNQLENLNDKNNNEILECLKNYKIRSFG